MATTDAHERIDLPADLPAPVVPPSDVSTADQPASLGSRLKRPQTLISFGLALAIMAFFFRRLDINFSEVWQNVRQSNPLLFLAAFGVYYASMYARAVRWRWMLQAAGVERERGAHLPSDEKLTEILLLSWFVNCVVPARLGDAYRGWLLKREAGASFSATIGTILAERLVDLVVLVGMMVGAGILTFHGRMPGQARQTFIAAGVLVAIGAVGLLALWIARHHIERRLPAKWQGQFARLHDALFACLRRPGRYIVASGLIWLSDGLRLLLVTKALGVSLPLSTAAFVALMSSMLTTLPITPAGLGVVEAAMIVVLKWVGVVPSMATSVALMDRLITYWSLILLGLLLYGRRFRADVRVAR